MKTKISGILFLLFAVTLYGQSDYRIISSDRNSLVLEYTPDYSDSLAIPINNFSFRNTGLVNGYYQNQNEWGNPAVPVRLLNVGVPSEFGNTIQILSSSFKEISGKLIPIPKPFRSAKINNTVYEIGQDYNKYRPSDDLVTFGDYGLARGIPVQSLIISPVKYFPAQNKIHLYTKIIFKITFSQLQAISAKPADNMLDGAIVNFGVARNWNKDKLKLNKGIINSVLATGKWVRFETPEEGIYKITKSELASFGFDANSIDPRTIKIYNNSGKVLPEVPDNIRPADLVENAITVVGESDGKFDDADYILFYGRGNNFWDYDLQSKTIRRYFHPYSNKNYFWITAGGPNGKRIAGENSLNSSSKYLQTSTKAFASQESDKKNIAQTGREYVGDSFSKSNPSVTYTNKLDGRISSIAINYKLRFVNASADYIGLELFETGTKIFSQFVNGYGSILYVKGNAYIFNASYGGNLPESRSVLKFDATPASVTTTGYLDWFEIYYDRNLTAAGDNLTFYSKDTTATIEYDLSGFTSSNIQVYDVSDYSNVKEISNPIVLSGGNFTFQKNETAGNVSKYIAVGSNNFKTPVNPVTVPNSNLHGITEGAKFIIITSKDFITAAEKLKNYRETQSRVKISTTVIDVSQIYNEFSCGLVDVSAIRDFIKYAYDNWSIKPEFVLFFGKGTYDYKNVEGFGNNYVPAYETQESLSEIPSYASDDFYVKVNGNDNFVDLASGRITVENANQANNVINKITDYENNSDRGAWRNLITLVADDGYTGGNNIYEGPEHTAPSETLSNNVLPPSFDLRKIYMASYPVEITGLGRRMPTVNQAIIDAINEGTLILNYVGHGSPTQWAQEDVFNKATSLPQLKNSRYFFLSAATCDFGYYDIPDNESAAEALLFLNNSGAIASFTASRLVYSSLNHSLMYQLFNDLLKSKRDTLNLSIPIGKANFLTKQVYNGINDQKYHIIGDPTLRLLIPEYSANIDSINGNVLNFSSQDVKIKALSYTKINGGVIKPDNSPWNDFNGEGLLTIFDSQRTVPLPEIGNYPMTIQGGVIFKGRVSVANGKFAANFVVPKDISYENKNGKIIVYFFGNDVDGLAFTNKVIIGGTDTSTVNDGKGPQIELFFDDTAFKNTFLVNSNTTLIAKLSDETGLNTTGTGVGHKFVGILNGKENDPIDFTNYFTSDINSSGKSGEINYPFTNLASGDYKLEVKAWDVFNNFSTQQTFFSVVTDSALVIRDVYNYPNPFSSNTTFTFQQNLNKLLDLKIKVYTIAGRLIREIEKNSVNEKFVKVDWDGRDQDGSQIANGTYLYKILVRTSDGEFNKSVIGKLAVIR